MSQMRWQGIITLFMTMGLTLSIQIISAEYINGLSSKFHNDKNTTSLENNNNRDYLDLPINSSNDAIQLKIIENVINGCAEVIQQYNHKSVNRYKRSKISPPSSSTNSTAFVIVENLISKMREELTRLNASAELNTESKSRIALLVSTFHELQTFLDILREEYAETMQISAKKLETLVTIGMTQGIKSRQFSFAEEMLQLTDDSIYKKVVRKVYDHQAENINILLSFGASVQDLQRKFKVYETLYNEMKVNGHTDIQKLLQIVQTLRKGILDVAVGNITDISRSFICALWKDNQKTAITLISDAFLNDESWPTVHKLKDEIHRTCGLTLVADIYNDAINKVWDTLGAKKVLAKVDRNLSTIEERIMIHEAVINKLESERTLHNNNDTILLVRHMKETWDDPRFSNEDWRYRYKIIMNKLPSSLRNLVLSTAICIKNSHFHEYLHIADPQYTSNGYPQVFTWIPKDKHEGPQFQWKLNFHDDFQIKIRNVKNNEYLNWHNPNNCYSEGKCNSITSFFEKIWYFQVDGAGVQLRSNLDYEYLYADYNRKRDDYRRYVFVYAPSSKPSYPIKWEFVDCSNSSQGI